MRKEDQTYFPLETSLVLGGLFGSAQFGLGVSGIAQSTRTCHKEILTQISLQQQTTEALDASRARSTCPTIGGEYHPVPLMLGLRGSSLPYIRVSGIMYSKVRAYSSIIACRSRCLATATGSSGSTEVIVSCERY